LLRSRRRSRTSRCTRMASSMFPAACSPAISARERTARLADQRWHDLFSSTSGLSTLVFCLSPLPWERNMSDTRLGGVPMFRGLGQERLARLERHLEEKHLGSNEVVFRQGDPCDGLYVVARGGVVLRAETPGRPVERIRDLRPGEVFGETAALLDTTRRFAARTFGETVLWKIPHDLIQELAGDPVFEPLL